MARIATLEAELTTARVQRDMAVAGRKDMRQGLRNRMYERKELRQKVEEAEHENQMLSNKISHLEATREASK